MSIEDEWAALDAFLTGEFEYLASPDGEPDPLSLAGQDDANRAGRRIAALTREAEQVAAVVRAERDRLAAFEDDRLSGIHRRKAWLEEGLEGFMRMEHDRRGVSSVKLPSVTLKLRKTPDRVAGEATSTFLRKYEGLARVKITAELDKAAVKKATAVGPALTPADGVVLVSWIVQVCGCDPTYDYLADVPDDVTVHEAIDVAGEALFGVVYLVPRSKSFDYDLTSEVPDA